MEPPAAPLPRNRTQHLDAAVTTIQRQVLMPSDSTQIQYTLTHQGGGFVPDPLHVTTTWSDDCNGSFSADAPDVDVHDNQPVTRSATYTIAASPPQALTLCHVHLTVSDSAGLHITNTVTRWIRKPMTMFVSTAVPSPRR